MKSKKLMSVAVLLIIATLLGGCVTPPMTVSVQMAETPVTVPAVQQDTPQEEASRGLVRPVQFRAINVEQDLSVEGDATVLGDVDVAGDTTIDGGLTVTGGVTGTNVLTTGNQTVGGVKTFTDTGTFSGAVTVGGGYGSTGCTLSTAGVLQCNGAATIDGAATVTGALTAASVSAKVPVLAKTANYAVLTTDTGSTIKSTGSITMTLPAAAAGLHYCIVNYDGGDLTLDVTDTADVFLNEVNSAGDRVTNTTAYDSICVTAIDAVNWMTISSLGTWSDGN